MQHITVCLLSISIVQAAKQTSNGAKAGMLILGAFLFLIVLVLAWIAYRWCQKKEESAEMKQLRREQSFETDEEAFLDSQESSDWNNGGGTHIIEIHASVRGNRLEVAGV